MNSKIFLSIVIPVYNSENTIRNLVDKLVESLKESHKLEIILVNDSSTDDSDVVCRALCAGYKHIVRYIMLSKNVGEHSAVMAGLNQVKGDYAVIMDDDLQNPASEVNVLADKALSGKYDVVYSYYDEKKHSIFRNLGSWFNDKVANVMLRKPKDLYLSSFKILNAFLVKEIIKYDLPFPYIDGLILRTTDNIGKVKVKHEVRDEGKSGYTIKKLVSLWMNMFTNFSILPLRAAIVLGFVFSAAGLTLGVMTLIEKFLNPGLPIGWAALVVSVSVFAGVQLIALGMIGEYVGRIFLSQNKKPQYTIRHRIES